MNNRKYIMVGSPIITKEIFRKIIRPFNNDSYKPNGGFWASPYLNDYLSISEWFDYLMEARDIAAFKDLTNATIFTLKKDANILELKNKEDVIPLIKKYPEYYYNNDYLASLLPAVSIDFELLSQDYDGIYLHYNNLAYNTPNNIFRDWSVSTLLLFNLDCIKSYKTAYINLDNDSIDPIPYIEKYSDEKKIKEESTYHKELTIKAQIIFNELIERKQLNYKDYTTFIEEINKIIEIAVSIALENYIDNIRKIKDLLLQENLYITEEQIIKNIILNIISDYFVKEKKQIIQIPKSKIKTYSHD